MRVVFFGTSTFAVPSLQALAAAGHQIVRTITQPNRPQGRGLVAKPSPVKVAAQALQVPVEEPTDLRTYVSAVQTLAPDLGVAIAYGKILPGDLLRVPRHGTLGVHPSMLPKLRGANPIARAILEGATATGVTIFRLNERMDAGEIARQQPEPIHPEETTEQLSQRLSVVGAQMLVTVAAQLEQGMVAWQPQDDAAATLAAKFAKDDGRIDWSTTAAQIQQRVRAVTPWPGATTTWRGQRLKVWTVRAVDGPAGPAGRVAAASADGLRVATGRGHILITELQLAGSRRMPVGAFLRGHAVQTGDILGGDR